MIKRRCFAGKKVCELLATEEKTMTRMLAGGTTCWPGQGCQVWVPEKDHLALNTFDMAEASHTTHVDWEHVHLLQAEENRPFSYIPSLPLPP